MLQFTEIRDVGIIVDNQLHFNSQIFTVVNKDHVHAFLILRTFMSRYPRVLNKAFTTCLRPVLESCGHHILPVILITLNYVNEGLQKVLSDLQI